MILYYNMILYYYITQIVLYYDIVLWGLMGEVREKPEGDRGQPAERVETEEETWGKRR